MKLNLIWTILLSGLIFSCNSFKVKTNEDGTRVQIHSSENSKKYASEGDQIEFDMEVRNAKDSILSSTYEAGQRIIATAQKGFYYGSLEDAVFHIAEGDSATVFVKADSLFKVMGQMVPDDIGAGTDMRFIIKMHKVLTKAEYDEEVAFRRDNENKLIKEYVDANFKDANIIEGADIYYVVHTPGSGELIKENNTASVTYVGTKMDGTEFDSGDIQVTIGQQRVIPGWEKALQTMKKGGKSTFVIPSKEAYGEANVGPIAPYTPLIFEITVNDIN